MKRRIVGLLWMGLVIFFVGALSQAAWGANNNVKQIRNGKTVYVCKWVHLLRKE